MPRTSDEAKSVAVVPASIVRRFICIDINYRTIILFVNNRMIVLFSNRCYRREMPEARKRPESKQRTNDPVGVRNRLINAAAQAFQANGFAATSMHDVRSTAGATGGALYHHFPTKKALALAVISERVSTEVAATWISAVREADDAATGILSVFDDVIVSIDNNGSVSGCPLGNLAVELSLADADIREALAQEYETWRQAIVFRLSDDHACGAVAFLDKLEIEDFSYFVVALFSGAMAVAKAEQRSTALKACANRLRRIMSVEM